MGSTATLPPAQSHTAESSGLLDKIIEQQAQVASRYKPVMDLNEAQDIYAKLRAYVEKHLIEGADYGSMPGVAKPFLFKSGAQKLCKLFGYVPRYVTEEKIEDWTGKQYGEPLFYYRYNCTLEKDGAAVGQGIGSSNSWETKHRYRWVRPEDIPLSYSESDIEDLPTRDASIVEFAFAIEKAETTGKYGKPKDYWNRWQQAIQSGEARHISRKTSKGREMDAWEMGGKVYRIHNDQFPDVINTCQKQGCKRAYVEATLSATGMSDIFTQDEEIMGTIDEPAEMPDGTKETRQPAEPAKKAAPVKERAVPKELTQVLANLDKDLSTAVDAYARIEGLFIKKAGDAGAAEYNRVADLFNAAYPQGTSDKAAHRAFILDLWEALQKVQPEAVDVAARGD